MAYVLKSKNSTTRSELKFEVAAAKDSPIVNPAFVVKNWGKAPVELKVNGKTIQQGKDYRFGHCLTLEGCDLIVWLKLEETKPVEISISPDIL